MIETESGRNSFRGLSDRRALLLLKRRLLTSVAVLMCAFLLTPCGARAQAPQPPAEPREERPMTGDASAIEELVRVLVENGTIKKEQASALMEKQGQPGFSPLVALTELLKAKGVISPDEADRVAKKAAASAQAVTLHYEPTQQDLDKMAEAVTDQIKNDLTENVKQEVLQETKKEVQAAAAPEWTKRIRFGGDIRLRYEGDFFNKNNGEFLNPSSPSTILNSQTEQDTFKVRARLGATANVTDNVEAAIRLTTGSTTNPVSTNQTMGNYSNKYSVAMDLAYLKFTPTTGLTFIGGRIPNPWFFTDLVWYRDLTFDGFAGSYQARFSDTLQPFFTAGAFPLQDVDLSTTTSNNSKYLFAGQVGLDIKPTKEISGKLGAAFYDYVNTRGTANNPAYPDQYDYTAPGFQQKGNTLFDIQPSGTTPIYTRPIPSRSSRGGRLRRVARLEPGLRRAGRPHG